jgi:hypothetical protein
MFEFFCPSSDAILPEEQKRQKKYTLVVARVDKTTDWCSGMVVARKPMEL